MSVGESRKSCANTIISRILKICTMIIFAWLIFIGSASAAKHQFEMTIEEVEIQVAPGLNYQVFGFNGQVPGPLIHITEGDDVEVTVTNLTSLPHTIHWHGINMQDNWRNDGVPGVTQKNIEPGEAFTYRWNAERAGSLWYHCHVNVNEHVGIRGMWGPIVVDPKEPTDIEKRVTKQVIMMMSTWESAYADKLGHGGGPLDVADYFSLNAKSFPITQPIRVKKGDVVRIRFYGAGGGMHSMHLHGHDMLVTHKDGYPLPSPYFADTVLLGPGERYDAIVEMKNPGRFLFHDHIDPHVTNAGKHPGGPITIIEYDSIAADEWYVWKDKKYDANFFYSNSLEQPLGLHNHEAFKGKSLSNNKRKRRQ